MPLVELSRALDAYAFPDLEGQLKNCVTAYVQEQFNWLNVLAVQSRLYRVDLGPVKDERRKDPIPGQL